MLRVFLILLFVSAGYSKITDVEEVLGDEKQLKEYKDCILGGAHCPEDGEELKEKIPATLKGECLTCSEDETKEIEKIFKFLKENKADWWRELVAKYDPEGTYLKKHFQERQLP